MADEQPHIAEPTFEHYPSGFGIGTPTPRISWRFCSSPSTIQGWTQHAYDIEIVNLSGTEIETYHVENKDSVLVPWPSQPLQSRGQARVRVRAYGKALDVDHEKLLGPGTWSPWATVDCALLDMHDWVADPITSWLKHVPDGHLRPLRFRKPFTLPSGKNITKSRLYITSFGSYKAYINGLELGDHCFAPGWTNYRKRINYQVFDVTSLLREAQPNLIGIEVGEGWYATRLGFWGGRRYLYGHHWRYLPNLRYHSIRARIFNCV